MNKFIDLLANFYTGKAVIQQSATDIHKLLIQPVFEYIKNIIEKSFCSSQESKQIQPSEDEFKALLVKLTELQDKINVLESAAPVSESVSVSDAKTESSTKESFDKLIEEINTIHDEIVNNESTNKGGNIFAYLSRKIKKTLKRRKHSKKNIKNIFKRYHYKSYKKINKK